LVCIPPLVKRWGVIRPRLDLWNDPRFRSVGNEMGKVAVIGIMAQVNTLVLRYLASHLQEGAVTWYWNATRLVDFAQGIIAVGVGSALLPTISRAVAEGDGGLFRSSFSSASRLAASLLFPAAGFILLFPVPCVALLYRHGAYSWTDVEQTASALQMLVPFMLALAGIQIVKKPFFALQRRGALIGVGAIGVGLTALALSLSTSVQFLAYLILLRRMVPAGLGFLALSRDLLKVAAAATVGAIVAAQVTTSGDWVQGPTLENAIVFIASGVVGIGTYTGLAVLLGVGEVRLLIDRIRARLDRR
jgi:putative peptidoglycan lipid II flippase